MMRILFVSNYFPPEVNAPAKRLHEHARQWVDDAHDVEVLTSVPNFPEGRIYDGFSNRYSAEKTDGIDVARVPMYVAENKGTIRRTLSYVSFMLSAIWFSRQLRMRPEVVVATSPQFFAAIAGYVIARLRRVPFVLEVRDLWPESVVAVGAMRRNPIIRFFEWLERFLYERADHIVVVTHAFKKFIRNKGIEADKITVLMNGADLPGDEEPLDAGTLEELRTRYDLTDKFVAAYIGTIGMAHRVDVMIEAAELCTDPNVIFMVVGTGAEREKLEAMQVEKQLPNVRLIDKQPREMVPYLLALTDVSVVHLKASPVFQTVIPSKIFEAMATGTPIVLGVEGETKDLIERAEAGITIEPENPQALVDAVLRLRCSPSLYEHMARSGCSYVHQHHDRRRLARSYASLLQRTVHGAADAKRIRISKLEPVEQL